jgi:hypothetical protein
MLEENQDTVYGWTHVKEPSVFMSGSKYFADSSAYHVVDMVVFFPRTEYVNGRPNWLVYDKGNRYAWPGAIPAGFTYPVMLLAFHSEEDTSVAVPEDIIELERVWDKKALVLTPGRYVVEIRDMHGHRQVKTLAVE